MWLRVAVLALFCGCARPPKMELGFYSGFSDSPEEQAQAEALFALRDVANRVLRYDGEQRWHLEIGREENGITTPSLFDFAGIEQLLRDERHKNLVVVTFGKPIMWNEEDVIQRHVGEVTRLLRSVGYQRVVILGSHAQGIHYVADTALATP